MVKKFLVMFAILFIFLVSFISASNVSLIESPQWQANLTSASDDNSAVFGDIDNDGDVDLINVGGGDKSRVYINNGTSLIENITWEQNLSMFTTGSLALGDVNNDGNLDLVISGSPAPFTQIYINNGTAFNSNSTWQNLLEGENGAGSYSVALGDIDNDGDLDLIFPGMSSSKVIYLNNGTTFVNGSSTWGVQISSSVSKYSTGLVDLDNDGDLDLSIMGSSGSASYLNNGTSFVEANSLWRTLGGDEASMAWGDYDNDGDFDYIVSASDFRVGINNGSTWEDGPSWELEMSALPWGTMMLGDYDNNGYLDLVNAGGINNIQIGQNNGTSFVRDYTAEANLAGIDKNSILWGDVDSDGDLDLLQIYNRKVYINNITTPNTAPTPPISFSNSYNNREIKLGWQNGSDNETTSDGLYYNLMIGNSSLNNHSIISGVYGGSGDASRGGTAFGYFGNMMQRKNFTLKVNRLQPSTNYTWYVQTIDTALKAGNWSTIQSFTTPADMKTPNITLNSPVDNFNSSSYTLVFNATVSDNLNLSNVSLWGDWDGGWHLNETNVSGINNTEYNFTVDLTSYSDGTYTWMIEARDNATNVLNSSIRTFTVDTINPDLNITTPINNSNSSNILLDVNYTISDENLESCWYSNDTNDINTTLTCGANITTIIWTEGDHNITIYANDSAGNINSSILFFTIDITNPNINITHPINDTTYTNNTLSINYTRSDANLESCWYSNDTMLKNTTLSNCVNITTITWIDGPHNVTIWANDSSGNLNSSEVVFRVDIVAPRLSITSPANNTNQSGNLNINYTISDANLESCWYSNDTMKINITLTCGTNITTITWSEGQHNLTIWANDSASNESLDSITFTIDSIKPDINITFPINNTNSTNVNLDVNFTRSDNIFLESCWYSNDTMLKNTTLASCANLSTIVWEDGKHNITIWANDSAGNENSSSIKFITDTTAPKINLISPANASTWTSSSTVTFSYNVTDVNIANCSLVIDSSVDQTDSTITENTTQTFTKTMSNADYTWNVNCTDYVDYENSSLVYNLTVSYTAPTTPSGGGSSGGSSSSRTTTTTPNETTIPEEELFDIDFSDVSSGSIEAEEGEIKTFSFDSEIKHSVTVMNLGEDSITLLITSDPITIQIKLGETKQIDINQDGINDLEIKLISIINSKAKFSLTKLEGAEIVAQEETEEAIRKEALFDVKVSIVNLFEVVRSGREVIAEIEAFNVNNIGQVDVLVDYYITSKEDNQTKLVEGSDTLAVEAVASFVRSLAVPYNAKAGKYLFNVDVSYQDKLMASGSSEFRVVRNYEIIIVVGIFVLIVAGIFVYLIIIRRKEKLMESKIKKMEKWGWKAKRKNGRSKSR